MASVPLCEQILTVISGYEHELSQFTQQVRACKGTSTQAHSQDLLPALDRVFASDKQLQDSFKQGTLWAESPTSPV